MRSTSVLAVATLAMGLSTAPVWAQTADVSGTWNLEVRTDQGLTRPTLTLEQSGETLTGQYSSEALGEQEVTGTVDGSDVRISFNAELQGQSLPVVYSGTLGEDGRLTGTLDIAGGAFTGSFTATRDGGD